MEPEDLQGLLPHPPPPAAGQQAVGPVLLADGVEAAVATARQSLSPVPRASIPPPPVVSVSLQPQLAPGGGGLQQGAFSPGTGNNDNRSPYECWLALEASELQPGVQLGGFEYSVLLLGYLVQQRLVEAKYCYMRANERYPRDSLLARAWLIGSAMCNGRYETALDLARSSATFAALGNYPGLRFYVDELRSRLTAAQLTLVARCYSTISAESLADLLALSPLTSEANKAELLAVVQRCGWPIVAQVPPGTGTFLTPNIDDAFKNIVESLHDSDRFGPVVSNVDRDQQKHGGGLDFAATQNDGLGLLESLVNQVTFFEQCADSVPAPAGLGSGGGAGKGFGSGGGRGGRKFGSGGN